MANKGKYPYDLRTIGILRALVKNKGVKERKGFTKYAYENTEELQEDLQDDMRQGRNIQIGRRIKRMRNDFYINYVFKTNTYSITQAGRNILYRYDRGHYP